MLQSKDRRPRLALPLIDGESALAATRTDTRVVAAPVPAIDAGNNPRSARTGVALVAVLTVVAAALRLERLQYGYAHGSIGYDAGVYMGSALQLVGGRLPYRDFVLVHPPAITVLLAPLALLAKVIGSAQAFALAKIVTGLAGAASVPLAARLIWHRGLPVALVAAAVLAVHDDAVSSAYEVLLEPWVVLFCLLGAVLVFDGDRIGTGRRMWWGAAVLGIACATKIWAIAPVLVLAALCLPDLRRLRRYLGGVAVGFAVIVVPFAIFAPGAFVREVFVVQLLRSSTERTVLGHRLLHLFSVAPPNGRLPSAHLDLLVAGAVLMGLLLAVAGVVLVRRGSPLERFAALSAAASVAMMLGADTFYWHYATFAVPFLALVAALTIARLRGLGRRLWTGLLAVCIAALSWTMVHRDLRDYRVRIDSALTSVVPRGACVVTSMASSTVTSDRFATGPRCPALLDSFGVALTYGNGDSPSLQTLRDPRLRALWLRAYRHADWLYLVRRNTPTVPSDPVLRRYLRTHFDRVYGTGLRGALYERKAS